MESKVESRKAPESGSSEVDPPFPAAGAEDDDLAGLQVTLEACLIETREELLLLGVAGATTGGAALELALHSKYAPLPSSYLALPVLVVDRFQLVPPRISLSAAMVSSSEARVSR